MRAKSIGMTRMCGTFSGNASAPKSPAAAPYVHTDSRTVTGLKQLHDIGELVPNKGVYLHTVKLPSKYDISLPEAYLWVAPQDIQSIEKRSLSYPDTLDAIASLKDFYGRDGVELKDTRYLSKHVPFYEKSLYQYFNELASADTSVKEGWTLATIEMLTGGRTDLQSDIIVVENNLYDLRKKMPKGCKFSTHGRHDSYQWSCSRPHTSVFQGSKDDYSLSADFKSGYIYKNHKRKGVADARPVCLSFKP